MSSTSREAWPTDKGAAAEVQLSATWRNALVLDDA